MRVLGVTHVALLDVQSEPRPYRVGWASKRRLLAISGEFAGLADALAFAHALSKAFKLPIDMRLQRRVLH